MLTAFSLFTSDGDYSQLTIRIREQGHPVFGFGVNQPQPALTAHARNSRA
jgi:hypothetical protein